MTVPAENETKRRAELAALRIDRGRAGRPRSSKGRWLAAAALLVALGLGARALLGKTPTVKVATAEAVGAAQAPEEVLSGSGYVVTGERYVSLGVRIPGRIERYDVEEGQAVKRGDALVEIDSREYQWAVTRGRSALESARADLALAESELRRSRPLAQEGIVSAQELDVFESKAAVARARVAELAAELEQAKVNLEYTVLRSPSDGVVLAKLKEVGEIAVPGGFAGSGDLVRIANLADLRAEVDVNESDLSRVRLGQAARVTPDAYPDARYPAAVAKLYPQVDRQKGTLKVEVRVLEPDARLLPDMSVRVTFLGEAPKSADERLVLVPAGAVQHEADGNRFVWVVDGTKARRVVVSDAGLAGERARIVAGLAGGERVVTAFDRALEDGTMVRIDDAPASS